MQTHHNRPTYTILTLQACCQIHKRVPPRLGHTADLREPQRCWLFPQRKANKRIWPYGEIWRDRGIDLRAVVDSAVEDNHQQWWSCHFGSQTDNKDTDCTGEECQGCTVKRQEGSRLRSDTCVWTQCHSHTLQHNQHQRRLELVSSHCHSFGTVWTKKHWKARKPSDVTNDLLTKNDW